MSRENVEVVRNAIDAWNRGDWDAALSDVAADFTFDFSRAVGPQRGVYRRDDMRRFWEDFVEVWESVRLEADELIDAGDYVVMPVKTYHRGRQGIQVQTRASWLWTVRKGRITRLRFFQAHPEALEAAGLSE